MGMFDNEPPKVMSIGQLAQSGAEGLGRGFNKAMGFGSKKDAVMEIMKNTDYKNAESMMEGFKGIMSIDPSAAQEYRTQIMPMIKELQSLEKGQIDITTKLQLPKLTSLWNFGGVGRNWRQGYAIKYLKMTREQAAKLNTESDLLNALKNYHKDDTKSTDYNANIKRFDRASKLAKENYLSNAAIPGYAQDSESKLDLQRTGSADASTTDVVDPNAASSRGKVLGIDTTTTGAVHDANVEAGGIGYGGTEGFTQVNPESASIFREGQEDRAKHEVRMAVSNALRDKAPVALFGDLTLSVAESKQNDINEEINAWARSAIWDKGNRYFFINPDKVQAFIDDPHGFYAALSSKDKIKAKAEVKKAKKKEK